MQKSENNSYADRAFRLCKHTQVKDVTLLPHITPPTWRR